jgi:hypothetical protein
MIAGMGIRDLWRQARGVVLRREYEDLMARMNGANVHARRAFLNNIEQTIDDVVATYSAASERERRAFSKEFQKAAKEMWTRGDWPSALGAGVSLLNAQSRFVPGDDAAYVRAKTDALVKEARHAANLPWPDPPRGL